jgi:nucleotide-binding universal stress UspA family protein
MYERIVVPLDGSEPAERALPWARTIAARSDGDLRLVHVHTPLRIPTSQAVLGPRVGEALRKLGEDRQEEAAAYLEAMGERLKEGATPSYSTALLRGPTAASVARDAQSTNAALIVMAPRDRKALERLRDGSVTEQLARTGPVPVLAIRGEEEGEGEAAVADAREAASERAPDPASESAAEEPATEPPECRCILVPLDGTSRCEAALEHAAAMGALFDATVILVRVERPGQWAAQPAATYLDEVADGIHRAGLAVETRVLADRDVVGAVYAMVEETGAGMIVVGSRYRDGLPRLIRGGLAETFLRSSPVPVLVVSGRCVKEGAKGR